jgi:hypothetical protein
MMAMLRMFWFICVTCARGGGGVLWRKKEKRAGPARLEARAESH